VNGQSATGYRCFCSVPWAESSALVEAGRSGVGMRARKKIGLRVQYGSSHLGACAARGRAHARPPMASTVGVAASTTQIRRAVFVRVVGTAGWVKGTGGPRYTCGSGGVCQLK